MTVRWQHTAIRSLASPPWAAVLLFVLLTVVGSRGESSQTATELSPDEQPPEGRQLDQDQRKKSLLEIGPLQFQPAQAPAGRAAKMWVKPGHWMPTVERMQANSVDFVGTASVTLVDDQMQPVPLEHTRFTFQVMRPVVLAKDRAKLIAGELFVPENQTATHVRSRLLQRESGAVVHFSDLQVARMPSYQYYLVVLAKEASRYAFLKVSDSVRAEWEEEYREPAQSHYRVALANTKDGVALPSSFFCWSSIACLVWDEVDATQLSAAQQQALLDWLHWGGRLIISGPDSFDTLRGSFLQQYLPALSRGRREISAGELRGWSAVWSARNHGASLPPLAPERSLSGVKLAPRADAREVAGGGGLFYQRDVGLGSIVVSAVRLDQRELVNWPGFDGFLNSALLGRPRREFSTGPYGGLRVDWFDYRDRRLDAHLVTGLRLFARDASVAANVRSEQKTSINQSGLEETSSVTAIDRPGGLGAWSNDAPVSRTTSDLLAEAAGVEMPGAGFVLACLALYLMVLVPLNWMIFHTLGRVEWAWFAAPVIAVAGTYAVVSLAQLDIGFVRSQTEIAVLELQGPHPRGLLSRYTALYSSLSTTYDVKFDQPEAVATPFASREKPSRIPRDQLYNVSLEENADTVLRGLAVASNSTRMWHGEQMIPLAGALKLGLSSRNHRQVENYSGLHLHDVAVVRRYFQPGDERPRYDASWIGDLRHGASAVLGLKPFDWSDSELLFAAERERTDHRSSVPRLDVDELLKLAFQFPGRDDPRYARREEYRLVGRIDEVLPGTEIDPTASQVRGATVVLAHLQYGDPPIAQPDVNSRGDLDLAHPDFFNEPTTDD